MCRTEKVTNIPTLHIGQHAVVENIALSNIYCENQTGELMQLIDDYLAILKRYYIHLRSDGEAIFSDPGQ